ncbi:MAG: SufE family protein [Gammaproteobacteria bacterium]
MQDTMTLDDIRDAFRFFDSWEDKYRFVIDLGKSLPALPDDQRIDAHLVRGCQSQVWLVTRHDAASGRLEIALDSDAHIVRGLIAIVLAAYAGRTPRGILDFDIDGLFAELDLLSHLSPTRGNGLRAMVARIQDAARACG